MSLLIELVEENEGASGVAEKLRKIGAERVGREQEEGESDGWYMAFLRRRNVALATGVGLIVLGAAGTIGAMWLWSAIGMRSGRCC